MSTETDIENLMEHAAYVWHFDAKDEQGNALELSRFSIYGAAEAPGQVPRSFAVTVDENRAPVTMPVRLALEVPAFCAGQADPGGMAGCARRSATD